MNLIFDLFLLLGVSLFRDTKDQRKIYYRNKKMGYSETSMECLAFDVLHEQAKDIPNDSSNQTLHDGGPDW